MADIVGIGANVYDTLITVSDYPKEDTKQRAKGIKQCGGGPCATGLVAAAKLGANAAYIGALAKDGGGTVAQTLTAAIKSDDLISLVYALKRPYRKKASFIMNDKTIAEVRKLKDNNGAYIWQESYQTGEPGRLLGYPVHTSAFAPTDAIAFGDYSYYNIGDRGSRSFSELRELFAGNGMIGYVAKERVDGKLILPEAVQISKLKTTTTTTS